MHDYKRMFDLIQNSTFIENVNNGVTVPPGDYFGAKTGEGMAYSKDSLYNKRNMNRLQADMTKIQSNYMTLKGTK
tara:strand:+ start:134 stop:358 length:225 start_codon:yes stop_codon:yes gene_type:complete